MHFKESSAPKSLIQSDLLVSMRIASMKNILITDLFVDFSFTFDAQTAFSQSNRRFDKRYDAAARRRLRRFRAVYRHAPDNCESRSDCARADFGFCAELMRPPQTKFRLYFFAHGFGGTSYLFYETLMRQLASNGYIVVFSPYTASIFATHTVRYNQLWNGFLTAAQDLSSAIMDLTKIRFRRTFLRRGRDAGNGAARSGAGLGRKRFVFVRDGGVV